MTTETTEPSAPEAPAQPARISPLSIETARRMLGEASADIAASEARRIECEATLAKVNADIEDATRRRAKAIEALRQLHRDEPLRAAKPYAVDNGHLVGA